MTRILWKTLDELHGDGEPQGDPNAEFTPEVERALAALRREHGIDAETGELVGAAAGAPAEGDEALAHAEDLRSILPQSGRRGFLKLTGAAAVFGLTSGCWHYPPETLVPYDEQPEGSTIGEAQFFSTTLRVDGKPVPALAKTYDFRPIKLEGNPDDPQGRGTLSLRGQASLLDLYDPDRAQKGPHIAGKASDWSAIDAAVGAAIAKGSVALLSGPVDGPANAALLATMKAALGDRFRHVVYDAFSQDAIRQARGLSFGAAAAKDPVYNIGFAKVIVSLGSCFLTGGHTGLDAQVGFGDFRTIRDVGTEHAQIGQLISFEPTLSLTGSMADLRHRVAMEDLEGVAWAIAAKVKELLAAKGVEAPALPSGAKPIASFSDAMAEHPATKSTDKGPNDPILNAAQALVDNQGAGLVYVGGANHNGPRSVGLAMAANYLNAVLGNEGKTVETASSPASAALASQADTVALLKDCEGKKVDTLIIWDANPVYSLPTSLVDAANAIKQVATVVVLADRQDETAKANDKALFAPITHDLESWGDAEPRAGVYSLQQPVIRPLWNSRQAQQSLLAFMAAAKLGGDSVTQPAPKEGEKSPKTVLSVVSRKPLWSAKAAGVASWHSFVRRVWTEQVRGAVGTAASVNAFWQAALARGVVKAPTQPPAAVSFTATALPKPPAAPAAGTFSLVLNASRQLGDGRQANNAWLQEVPDPIGKITWDNYMTLSLEDAYKLGKGGKSIERNSLLSLTSPSFPADNQLLEYLKTVPVVLQPGQKPGTIELFLGWGRTDAGLVAKDALVPSDGVGQRINAFQLAQGMDRWGIPVEVAVTGQQYELAETQHHHYMDGRKLAHSDPLALHQKDPSGQKRWQAHGHFLWKQGTGSINKDVSYSQRADQASQDVPGYGGRISMWDSTHVYPGRRWGMSIDLSKCTGCNACLVACSAENNVPVVGRDQIRAGREMHWLRVDRYYSSPRKKEDLNQLGMDEWNRPDSSFIEKESSIPEHLEVIHQLMICQQCEHAPCEEVCPAMATMHNEEGINLQIYNRCIGTRFCANNCPYKVRRFNFYEYSKLRIGPRGSRNPLDRSIRNFTTYGNTTSQAELGDPDAELGIWEAPLSMVLNPEVAIRSKGVMEKCNFCVQRTRTIREEEKRTGRAYDDTAPANTTACAQTCPSQAIVFGDINDPHSNVNSHLDQHQHHFKVLDFEANTRPSIQYLRVVRNRQAVDDEKKAYEELTKEASASDGKSEGGPS